MSDTYHRFPDCHIVILIILFRIAYIAQYVKQMFAIICSAPQPEDNL